MRSFHFAALAFAALLCASPAAADRVLDVFQRLDVDGDGLVRLSDIPQPYRRRAARADANNDDYLSLEELMAVRRDTAPRTTVGTDGAAPDLESQRYSDAYTRSVMDIWLADGTDAAPIVVYFHGGGFSGGNRSSINLRADFLALPGQGIAFASVGYPLERDIEAVGEWGHLPAIFEEGARALRYLRSNASDLGIDPNRIILAGSSAGTVIAQYLGYADPQGIEAIIALQQPNSVALVDGSMRAGGPDLFLFTQSAPRDATHHPNFARQMFDACVAARLECHMFGSAQSGLPPLPANMSIVEYAIDQLGH